MRSASNEKNSVHCLNPWDPQSKRQYMIDGAYCALNAGQSQGGQAHGVCYCFQQNQREEVRIMGDKTGAITAESGMHNTNYVFAMSERPISMMVTENISNTITATDYKGAQVVCYEV